jgi:hypothetical protein
VYVSLLKARIDALEKALRAVRMRQLKTPYDELDPLSQSMVDVANDLTALDEQGKAALLDELNQSGYGMDAADLERMIRSICVDY